MKIDWLERARAMRALADPSGAAINLELRRQRLSDLKHWLGIAAVLAGGALWWHLTPWKDAALWGPFGCGQARAVMNMVPEGCEPSPPKPLDTQIVVGNEKVPVTQTMDDGHRVWREVRR